MLPCSECAGGSAYLKESQRKGVYGGSVQPVADDIRRAGESRGAAMVEFAIVFSTFMLLVTGMFNYAITFWRYNQLQHLTDKIARELSVSPNLCGTVGASELGSVEFLLSHNPGALREYRRYVRFQARGENGEGAEFLVKGNADGFSFRVEASSPMGCKTCLMMKQKRLHAVAHAVIEKRTC